MASFLGFANFYWHFIKNFSHKAKPFNELKGIKEWKWDNECKKTFKELKDKITIQSVLVLPKRDKKFRVEINTSGYAIKRVLSQEQEEK